MRLVEKQWLFADLVAKLLKYARKKGYRVSLGEAWRPKETASMYARSGRGIANSLHCSRLAIDVNLFKDGKYLTDSESYELLGRYWERQNELCCWGGRFSRPDGNHFSITHNGVK
jgi:hypothetical protein